jgi:hypothetical protein
MKLISLLATLVIAAPSILAVVEAPRNIKIEAPISALSIFGVEGDQKWLDFQTTEDRRFLLVAASGTTLTTDLRGLKSGDASFRHTSDEMMVNVSALHCHYRVSVVK